MFCRRRSQVFSLLLVLLILVVHDFTLWFESRRRRQENELADVRAVAHLRATSSKFMGPSFNDYDYTPDIVNQNSLFLILAAPASAWISGMGLFKTLLVMVIMHRWVPGGQFEGPMSFLGLDLVLYVVVALAAVELVVDMVPRWDIHWDKWNLYPRVAGAVVFSWLLLSSEDVLSQIIMASVGAALALTSYTAKTSARRAALRSNTAAFVAPVSSVTENCLIASTLLPLTQLPPMTLLLILFMLMAAMLVIFVVRDEARETFRWIFYRQWVEPAGRSLEDNGLQTEPDPVEPPLP